MTDEEITIVLNKTANYTDILYQGEGAKEAAEAAFGPSDSDYILCAGQLSRKHDFIPALSKVLHSLNGHPSPLSKKWGPPFARRAPGVDQIVC